jgi:deoxyribodipyrimidine photo-lyase
VTAPALVWFRNDLRLADNPALDAAAASGRPVIALYVLDETLGGAARWWLHHSLVSLERSLAERGVPLLLRRGDPLHVITETGAALVTWNRCYDAASIARDKAVKAALAASGVAVESFNGSLLHEPWTIKTGGGTPFLVFTPFWRAARADSVPAPLPIPTLPRFEGALPPSDPLESWHLLPTKPDWAGGLRASWQVGEAAAAERFRAFLDAVLPLYAGSRDRPDRETTSRLSPYLRWGEISPRQVWHGTMAHYLEAGRTLDATADKFLAELGWREFSYHLLFHHPELPTQPLRRAFDAFPWAPDPALLRAWQQGRTGIPLVDAGMRQLWQTGWMHNRVRMVTASFLTKHLLQPWQDGAAWFQDTLVDADIASNAASWQWVAGCGADAAPYFRVFNPLLQGEKFDPSGAYVRRYAADSASLTPIIDLAYGRQRALSAYEAIKQDASLTGDA